MGRAAFLSVLTVGLVLVACGGTTASVPGSSDGYRLQTNPDGSATGDGKTCVFGGVSSNLGASFESPDGCNDCKCTEQGAACTERACGSSSGSTGGTSGSSGGTSGSSGADVVCNSEGKTYRAGESWTIPNPKCPPASAHCTCQSNGQALCRMATIGCPEPTECKDESGNVHQPGDKWNDGCNDCTCSNTGSIACTKKQCTCPSPGTINCQPAVPPERAAVCSGPYHEWVEKNCPNVSFVY